MSRSERSPLTLMLTADVMKSSPVRQAAKSGRIPDYMDARPAQAATCRLSTRDTFLRHYPG